MFDENRRGRLAAHAEDILRALRNKAVSDNLRQRIRSLGPHPSSLKKIEGALSDEDLLRIARTRLRPLNDRVKSTRS